MVIEHSTGNVFIRCLQTLKIFVAFYAALQLSHSTSKMCPVATDGVAWSVGLSVGHSREPCKKQLNR